MANRGRASKSARHPVKRQTAPLGRMPTRIPQPTAHDQTRYHLAAHRIEAFRKSHGPTPKPSPRQTAFLSTEPSMKRLFALALAATLLSAGIAKADVITDWN